MNVILDASPLGIGFYHAQARTGVGRVVEQLIRGLHDAPEVTLKLAAPTHLSETLRYARETFGEAMPAFVNPAGQQRWATLENGLLAPLAKSGLPSKVIRQAFYAGRKWLGSEQARFTLDDEPAGTIYHSPFYALPDAVSRNSRLRRVLTVHDLIPLRHPEWFPAGEEAVRQAITQLPPDAFVVTVSEATKADFCAYTGFDPDRVTSIPLAASRDLFYPVADDDRKQATRARFGLGDEPYLLSLATLEPRKNLDHLIRCFVDLIESRALPDAMKLVLVGTKGWKMEQILAQLAKNDAVRSRVLFTGFVPDAELAPLYAGATAFVYPSLYEGFGLPPLEAMQCGLPVITSNVASLPEVVGDAGLLVPPTDADALKAAILAVVTSPEKRRERAGKALQRAALFSWERFITQHIDLYKRML